MRSKITLITILIMLISWHSFAQITSSSMTGFIKDDSSKGIPGAIVRATHVPSGTVYGTATQNDGSFNIQNMRVGGPYKVEVSFLGYETQTFSNIYLTLGETYELNGKMENEGQNLQEVAVRAHRDPILNNQRTGATSDVDATQIATLPSINRAVSDFTKLSPQSGASFSSSLNNGNSFAGRDGRYNNVQINGANFNNAFGLSSSLLPGGASQPIPLDAIDEIQIAIAPYDVRQSNFTGANINAVTRSGTNEFTGSVYTYWRNQNFNGVHVGDNTDLPAQVNTTDDVYGARLGGPIIKNKLFFFVNDEYEKNISPGLSPQYVANGSTGGTQTRVSADSLQMVSDFVKQKYGYNTGAYQNYYNQFTQEDNKFIARLDWNINSKNKADFSFSDLINHNPVITNATSAAGGSLSNSRVGPNSMSFANSIYGFKDAVKSFAGEVVSNISSKVSNQVLATYTMVRDTRTSPSSPFPFIDIATGASNYSDNQISLGYELFTYDNDVKNNTLSIYDNVTITQGKNNITAGADFQYLTFADGFVPYGTGYYRFASVQDFLSDAAPTAFGYTYPYQGGQGIYVQTNYGLAGIYGQDKINVTKHLTLTAGLRIDVPMYLNKLTANPYIDTLNLLNKNGGYTHYDVSKWPTSKPVFSPRIAFNWDPKGDRSIQVRGGTGIFMGQVPFVWFTNQPGNSGTTTNQIQLAGTNAANEKALQQMTFNRDPKAALAALPDSLRNLYYPQQAGSSVPGQIALVDPNFKMPEVWRTDLAVDVKLPWGLVGTAELLYTKDIINVYYFNANLPNAQTVDSNGGDNRPAWTNNRLYSFVSGAYVLENTNKGYSYSGTIGIARPAQKGLYGSLYYTGTYSAEVTSNPGTQPNSTWNGLPNTSSPNTIYVGPSEYLTPHRVIGTLSYRIEYAHHLASTLSLVYEGASQGRFSYEYNKDINGDGVTNDLIYIPNNANDLTWAPITNAKKQVLFTAQQQADAFNAYIAQDKYLSSHKGQYATPYGAKYPFYNRIDLRFLQDIYTNIGKRRGTLQFSVDILNVGNMINPNWGVQDQLQISGYSNTDRILNVASLSKTYVPTYQLATYTDTHGNQQLATSTFSHYLSTTSTWGMQLGLRFTF